MTNIEQRKQNRDELVKHLESVGAKFKGNACTCPFHDDKRPSAGVFQSEDGWRFKCQTCGVKGDIWDIIARNTGKPIAEVIKESSEPTKKYDANIKTYPTVDALSSCCGNVTDIYKYTNPETNALDMIVIRSATDKGKTFRQCRPVGTGFQMKSPVKPWPLYNRTRVAKSDTVIVVEGEKCVHALVKFGFVATTSPGGAKNAKNTDWSMLAGKNVVLWPDNDESGEVYIRDVAEILHGLEPAPNLSVLNPAVLDLAEKEDAADFIDQMESCGYDVPASITAAITQAAPQGVSDGVLARIDDIIAGRLVAVDMPWATTTRLSNAIVPGKTVLICGSPNASKSFMMLQAVSFWIELGHKVAIYMLEDDREYHLIRALAQKSGQSGITNMNWVAENGDLAKQIYTDNREFLEKLGKSIHILDKTITLDEIVAWTIERAKEGCRIVAIDPITIAAKKGDPWTADTEFLYNINTAARDYDITVILVTHPVKAVSIAELASLSGGAAYGRFSRSALWLEAHDIKTSKIKTSCGTQEMEHNRTLSILKCRDGEGLGAKIACMFETEGLYLREIGVIVREKK